MNRPRFLRLQRSIWKIDWLTKDVEHPAQRFWTDRNLNRMAKVCGHHAALHAVGGFHRDRTHSVLAKVLLDLAHDIERRSATLAIGHHAKSVVDFRQVARLEFDVDDRADYLDDLADILFSHKIPRAPARPIPLR